MRIRRVQPHRLRAIVARPGGIGHARKRREMTVGRGGVLAGVANPGASYVLAARLGGGGLLAVPGPRMGTGLGGGAVRSVLGKRLQQPLSVINLAGPQHHQRFGIPRFGRRARLDGKDRLGQAFPYPRGGRVGRTCGAVAIGQCRGVGKHRLLARRLPKESASGNGQGGENHRYPDTVTPRLPVRIVVRTAGVGSATIAARSSRRLSDQPIDIGIGEDKQRGDYFGDGAIEILHRSVRRQRLHCSDCQPGTDERTQSRRKTLTNRDRRGFRR